jgi:2-polyprenyl-3-methyl-5-hydroxy-6-metoxy-1,4-benzoquinol methylase
MSLAKKGDIQGALTASSVMPSDAHYGCTADIYRCADCGFLECCDLGDLLSLYRDMDDFEFESTRAARAVRANRLLDQVEKYKPGGRLLDVGAGSGVMVESATNRGYDAIGIEPSGPMQARAAQSGLPVIHGVLPHPGAEGPFDVVSVIDVIEHVPDPVGLARSVADVMAHDGICVMVTPDVDSFAARLMGWSWWHYRIAHIGYFNKQTFTQTLKKAGLRPLLFRRPSWYFPAGYLFRRVVSYLPARLRPRVPKFLDRIVVPLNLFDSYLVLFQKER